jgi:hypothetical protein
MHGFAPPPFDEFAFNTKLSIKTSISTPQSLIEHYPN